MRISDCPHPVEQRAFRDLDISGMDDVSVVCINDATTTDGKRNGDILRMQSVSLCKRVVHTSHTMESYVSPSTHSCSAAPPWAEQVMVLDSDSVGLEESFTMSNVPAESAVTPQEKLFLLEQLRHLSSSGITGQEARRAIVSNVSREAGEDQGEQGSPDIARHDVEDLNKTGLLQSVCVWTDKTDVNADTWEAAIKHFSKAGVSSCFLMEIDKGCPQPSVYDDSMFAVCIGSLVQNAACFWDPAVKTNVYRNRCRVFGKKSMVGFVM